MKFYNDKEGFYIKDIRVNKLNCVYCNYFDIIFYKNAVQHNIKNAAYIRYDGCKNFYLNGTFYGYSFSFTKKSWRRFVKLQAFL